jgi:hypothetical protein
MNTAGFYLFSSYVIHGGKAHDSDGTLLLETPLEQWAFALEFPVSREIRPADELISVIFQASVEEGRLGFGILGTGRRSFSQEVFVSPADGQPCEFELILGPISTVESLIIRNACATGASRGRFRIVAAIEE